MDEAVPGTRKLISVRSTEHPLKLKVCNVPCLCQACILDNDEECANSSYTDAWKEVNLIPVKGDSKKKHMKRKHLKDYMTAVNLNTVHEKSQEITDSDDDDNLPVLSLEVDAEEEEGSKIDLTKEVITPGLDTNAAENIFIDLTQDTGAVMQDITMHEDNDIIIGAASNVNTAESQELQAFEDIPYSIYWESILGALERRESITELETVANEVLGTLRPLRKRKDSVFFNPNSDYIDATATSSLPIDGPQNVHAIWTTADGNCFSRSLSRGFTDDESMHVEMRARIVIEGAVNRKHYLTDSCLRRGASRIDDEETLPELYAKYSDHYVNGQKLTDSTIEYIYCKELLDCAKMNSYMGLWQFAQASSALNVPIQSVFPVGGDELMCMDFHRIFFPIEYNSSTHDEAIIVMWTSSRKGHAPAHFVPLLPKGV